MKSCALRLLNRKSVLKIIVILLVGVIVVNGAANKFNIGDTVRVTENLNVRTGAGTSYSEITDPDYPGYAPAGTSGKVLEGPKSADGYTWWKVEYNAGYTGWSAQDWLEKTPPAAPTTTSPGSSSAPGLLTDTLTPTLQWTSVSGADYYAVAISKYPYGSSNIIYNPQTVYGTSLAVPAGTLEYGQKYRWNMQAHNSAGWSAISNTLYFQTPSSPIPTTPAAPTTTSPGSSSAPGPLIDTLTPTLNGPVYPVPTTMPSL